MLWFVSPPAPQIAAQTVAPTANLAAYVDEAAEKTGVPAAVIWAVLGTESAGDPRAVSPRGAMGLMQLMPPTWDKLRRQYALGADAFDPHDNILAGAVYLRVLYDAYGMDGYLAAYNAGPARWLSYRDNGQPLPPETRNYVATIAKKLGTGILTFAATAPLAKPLSWSEAALFLPDQNAAAASTAVFAPGASPFVALTPPPAPDQ